jgi:polyhydroxyalkanoate synthesis regulator phasin
MEEAHTKAMEAHGEMNPETKKLHEEMMESYKNLSPEDAEKMQKMVEKMHHQYGTNCGYQKHEAFIKKIDGMDKKLDNILELMKVE